MPKITLITGGARSGKSSLALSMVKHQHAKPAFIATAQAFDREMQSRIENHRKERGGRFITIEEPLQLRSAILSLDKEIDFAIIDCLTVWLGNLFHHAGKNFDAYLKEIDAFIDALPQAHCDLVIVTNEVGWGIVPENALARSFRDMAGMLNQRVALLSHEVLLCVCGVALSIKKGPVAI